MCAPIQFWPGARLAGSPRQAVRASSHCASGSHPQRQLASCRVKSSQGWLSVGEFASLLDITPQAARKRVRRALVESTGGLIVRQVEGRGGRSGVRYEVLLSSLSEDVQEAFRADCGEANSQAIVAPARLPPKFIAAPNQAAAERRRHAALRLIAPTGRGTPERAQAIRQASLHNDVPSRTLPRWVKRSKERECGKECGHRYQARGVPINEKK